MTKATVKDIIAFAFFKRRKELSEQDIPAYGNAETDQMQAEAVLKFFENYTDTWQNRQVYEDYRMFEGLYKEIPNVAEDIG